MAIDGLRSRAGKYLGDALRGIQRAPVEVIATLCAAITFSWAVELDGDAFRSWAEVAVSCVLLIAVAWTGTLLNAAGVWSAGRRWAFTAAGVAVVLFYALVCADFQLAGEQWRAALLVGAAVLWLIALPAFAGTADGRVDRMRRIDGRILLRCIGAALYGAALFGGLALALRAIDVLFELGIEEQIYLHVWGWIAFVLIPWIVLGGLGDYVRPIDQENQVAGIAQRIALYLIPPLLVLYFLILYAYVVRILVTSEIPKNLVSPMVLAAGALSAVSLLVFDPRPAARGIFRWLRIAPAVFLPLAPLGAWALVVRIDQYGWTEFRVIRLLILGAMAILAIAATIQLLRRNSLALHMIPLGLAAMLLLSAVGPWSVLAISKRSQQHRLESALGRVGVELDARAVTIPAIAHWDSTARVIPAVDYEQIRSSAQYLAGHFGAEALPPVLRTTPPDNEVRWVDYAAALGFRPDGSRDVEGRAIGGSLAQQVGVQVEAGTAYRVSWSPRTPGDRSAASVSGAFILPIDSTRLAVHVDQRVLYAELDDLVRSLAPRGVRGPGSGELPADQAVLPITDATGAAQGHLIVWHIWMSSDSSGMRLGNLDGLVVVPRN